jgi:hypothetical protein
MTGSGNDQLANDRVNSGLLAAHLKQPPADIGARSAVVGDQDAHHVASHLSVRTPKWPEPVVLIGLTMATAALLWLIRITPVGRLRQPCSFRLIIEFDAGKGR